MNSRHDPFGLLAFLHWNHDWNDWHFNEEKLTQGIRQIRQLGVSFIRMDVLWSDVYDGPGRTNFERYDKTISLLREAGIQILGLLHYNKSHSEGKAETWNKPPESFEEFADYVSATVRHFRHQIHYWEIWNEPNHPVYWGAPPDNLQTYSRLLRASYRAAKSANPDATVLNGGITHPIAENVAHLYKNGSKNFFDILSIHTFVDPCSSQPEKELEKLIFDVRDVMAKNGDEEKKIWITEIGCPGIPADKPSQSWFQGKAMNEDQQTRWLEIIYGVIKKIPYVEKSFWAFYRDTDGIFKEATDHFGLVRFDLTPKPSFFKFKELIKFSSK